MSLFSWSKPPADTEPASVVEPLRAPILSSELPQSTNRYRLVGVWALATDADGRRYQTGEVDRVTYGSIKLSGDRFAECGDGVAEDARFFEATADEARVLGKRFVVAMVD